MMDVQQCNAVEGDSALGLRNSQQVALGELEMCKTRGEKKKLNCSVTEKARKKRFL